MLVLSVDTSGRQGGITAARGSDSQFEILESSLIQGGTFSAELVPQLAELLAKHRLAPQDLQGLIAVTGPGSFTGLRIGLTAVKGLGEALKLPIATVTSLEILLAEAGGKDAAMAVLDAGRGEVYAATRTVDGIEESLLSMTQALEMAKAYTLRIVTADEKVAGKFEGAETISHSSSEAAARIGIKKLQAGDTVDVLSLDANYIRRSDVEYLQRMKK